MVPTGARTVKFFEEKVACFIACREEIRPVAKKKERKEHGNDAHVTFPTGCYDKTSTESSTERILLPKLTGHPMHVCLFDIDGTLINTGGAGGAALKAALRSAFAIDEPTDSVTLAGRTDRGITGDLFRFHAIEDSPENWQRFRDAYLGHLPGLLAQRKGAVLPGIQGLLQSLQGRDDLLIGLLTGNTRDGARIKLAHFGLDRFFELGGFGDRHVHRDDVAREALEAVERRLTKTVDRSRVWVIGDTPSDIACARAIGARAVAVATGIHTAAELDAAEPDHLVTDFADPDVVLSLWR